MVTNAGEISLERESESDLSDEELDKAIQKEVRLEKLLMYNYRK